MTDDELRAEIRAGHLISGIRDNIYDIAALNQEWLSDQEQADLLKAYKELGALLVLTGLATDGFVNANLLRTVRQRVGGNEETSADTVVVRKIPTA